MRKGHFELSFLTSVVGLRELDVKFEGEAPLGPAIQLANRLVPPEDGTRIVVVFCTGQYGSCRLKQSGVVNLPIVVLEISRFCCWVNYVQLDRAPPAFIVSSVDDCTDFWSRFVRSSLSLAPPHCRPLSAHAPWPTA
jgi:hypothetical protein